MSADKDRSLARRTAWLRLGARECGFATGIEHAPTITDDVLRLEADGLLGRRRIGVGGRVGATTKRSSKSHTSFVATPAGHAALAETLAARGEAFGPTSLAIGPDNETLDKVGRRLRAAEPRPRHVLGALREAARRRARAFLETMRSGSTRSGSTTTIEDASKGASADRPRESSR